MPRRPRIQLNAVPLHIVQRGHNREACFFCEDDYTSYLHWLIEALDDNKRLLHAYALMTNHVHLLLAPKKQQQYRSASVAGAALRAIHQQYPSTQKSRVSQSQAVTRVRSSHKGQSVTSHKGQALPLA